MRTTFSRTLFSLVAMLFAAILLIGLSFQLLADRYMEEQAMSRLKKNCSVIVDVAAAAQQDDILTSKEFLINLSLVSHISNTDTVVCDIEGTLLVCSEDPFGCNHRGMVISSDYLNKVLKSGQLSNRGTISGLYKDERYVVCAPIYDETGTAIGIVISSMPTATTRQVIRRLSDQFLSVAIFVAAIAAVVVTIYAKKHSSPLQELSNAAVSFGHGNLKSRVDVPKKSPKEVHELALAFNNMADSLEKSETQRQEFIANVSHELKTPMTTISGFIDGILDGTIPSEQQSHYLEIVSAETKRLSRLVRSMLDISQLQAQDTLAEESLTRFELSECMGQALLSFEKPVEQKQIHMDVNLPERPVYVKAHRDHITQVLYNLMDNAIKFCPQAGNISVSATISGNKAYVSIANDGQTIPSEELSLLFDRFHKLDKSRSENRDGWGLGLYIVKTIIGRHGEDISVSSHNGVTEFTFTLTLVN